MDTNLSDLAIKAESGDAESQYVFGSRLFNGDGCKQDLVTAFKWFMRAAAQDHANSQLSVSNCFRLGNGITQDFNEAFKWCQKSANLGNSWAFFYLAVYHQDGIGTTQDPVEALNCYKRSAELRNIDAIYEVVTHYVNVAKNYAEALNWLESIHKIFPCTLDGDFTKLRAEGYSYWFHCLGDYYLEGVLDPDASGNVINKDYYKAYRIFKIGAFANDITSIYRLFRMRSLADANPYLITDKEAAMFASLGAKLGDRFSENILGDFYSAGLGVPKSAAEAVNWWTRAAHRDDYDAQYKLGEAFQDGVGVARDLVEAYAWFNLAAAGAPHHESKCKEARDSLEVLLTPDQLVFAQKRSTEIHAGLRKS